MGWIERHAAGRAGDAAVQDADGVHTFAAMAALESRYAMALERIPVGAYVVLFAPQRATALALLAACTARGLHAALVSTAYGEAHARASGASIGAQALLTLDGDDVRIELLAGSHAPLDPSEPSLVVFTSATTGPAKAVRHLWSTLEASVRARAPLRYLCVYPLSHFAALQVVAQALFTGGTLLLPEDLRAETGLRWLMNAAPDALCATPSYVRQLLMAATPEQWSALALRRITLGGEIADSALLDRLRASSPTISVTHIYASTELGTLVTVRDGRAGFDAALIDGESLKLDDGQLHARPSARSMIGYVGAPGASGGWIPTGDLVEVVEGRAHFRGRASETINVGGYKVRPAEVEAVIRTVPGVRDVCIVGHRSSILGAIPKAILVADPTIERTQLEADILAAARARLPAPMVPRLFEYVHELERSVAQKVVRGGHTP